MKGARLRLISVLLLCATLLSLLLSAEGKTGPEWRDAVFDRKAAVFSDGIGADLSHLDEGYAAFTADIEGKLKVQVSCGGEKYNYDLSGDGTPLICPMNMGSGSYSFKVLKNVSGDKYAVIWSGEKAVSLRSEFEPFLRPGAMVRYDKDSDCVALAEKLTENLESDVEIAAAIYEYLVEQLSYDHAKASTVKNGYVPDPDSVLAEKKGICFDYASLACAMLRSRGVPCRLITGYVEPDNVYHAWNEIYLKDKGWVAVKIKAKGKSWKHVDITFASSGVSPSKTDNESLYTKRYTY